MTCRVNAVSMRLMTVAGGPAEALLSAPGYGMPAVRPGLPAGPAVAARPAGASCLQDAAAVSPEPARILAAGLCPPA